MELDEIVWAVQIACLLEACAKKPGNVNKTEDFSDSRFEDFLISSVAIGPAFRSISYSSVGEVILRAVQDTKWLVNTNTNLGMVLLLAPLAKAAIEAKSPERLRTSLESVLRSLNVDDAKKVFEAIRLASPAGLGEIEYYDVRESNIDITLKEAMMLAKNRDTVAKEYITGFKITFETGFMTLQKLWEQGNRFSESVIQTFLTILAEVPDTHIARKNGSLVAKQVSQQARQVLKSLENHTDRGWEEVHKFDLILRDDKHSLNPGTTADLLTAVIYVFLLEDQKIERFPEIIQRW